MKKKLLIYIVAFNEEQFIKKVLQGMEGAAGGGHGRFTDPKVGELIEMTLEKYLK